MLNPSSRLGRRVDVMLVGKVRKASPTSAESEAAIRRLTASIAGFLLLLVSFESRRRFVASRLLASASDAGGRLSGYVVLLRQERRRAAAGLAYDGDDLPKASRSASRC